MSRIVIADDDDLLTECFPMMRQLRPNLPNARAFLAQIRRQQAQGYRLACLIDNHRVAACAGFRLRESLAAGRHLLIDDLVTAEDLRGRDHGDALFNWLVAEARRETCLQIQVDSGLTRVGAHRFYFHKGMAISGFRFTLRLD